MVNIRSVAAVAGLLALLSHSARAVPHSAALPAPADIITIGQPTPGGPVQLHGVVDSVDPVNHRIGFAKLSGVEYFWQPTVRDVAVVTNLDLRSVQPGTMVRFILSRDARKNYVVSAIGPY
jgi:hypothetical protein